MAWREEPMVLVCAPQHALASCKVIKLAVLGENEAVDRDLALANPLTVVRYFGPAVIGFYGVGVQVK